MKMMRFLIGATSLSAVALLADEKPPATGQAAARAARINETEAQRSTRLRQHIQALERAGRFAAAIPLYEEWQDLAPDQAPIVHGHARALAAIGQHQRVVALLDTWLEGNKDDDLAALLLGDAHRDLDDLGKALASWRRAIDGSAASYGPVADRCRAAGLRQEAIRILREGQQTLIANRKSQKDAASSKLYNWELASLYLEEAEYPSAIEIFIASLHQNPQRVSVVTNRLEKTCRTNGDEVLESLRQFIASDPLLIAQLTASCALAANQPESGLATLMDLDDTWAEQLFQYGVRTEALGYTAVAAQAYAHFAERRPESPYSYQALSRQAALTAIGDSETALDLYRRLAHNFPDRPETLQALVGMARLQLEKQGDIEGAITSLQTVVDSPRRGPWTPQALLLIAECSLRLGDLERCERFLSELEKKNSATAYEARFRRAELLYFRGDFSTAEQIFAELGRTDPAHPLANDAFDLLLICEDYAGSNGLAILSRAQLLERQGQTRSATEQWAWLESHAEPALAELSLLIQARLRTQEERFSLAMAIYERQLSRFPQGERIVSARLGIATLYERRGEIQEALKICEATLLQHPEDARAPAIRLRIQRLRALHNNG